MQQLIKPSRIAFGIMVIGLAVQQIFYGEFRLVIMPPLPSSFLFTLIADAASLALIAAGLAIIFDKNGRTVSLYLGGIFLLAFLLCQVPYELFVFPYPWHLGSWVSPQKEVAFAGGAFVVAGSYCISSEPFPDNDLISGILEKFIPLGSILFCSTMISFGIDHFLYADGVSTLVPAWIPGRMFWTYFAGAALIASGTGIVLRIRLKLTSLLLALMLFLWVLVLHIPRAIADPNSLQGNEISSVFEAFGFSGIALLMAFGYQTKVYFIEPLPVKSE